jgi:hypothetical protein
MDLALADAWFILSAVLSGSGGNVRIQCGIIPAIREASFVSRSTVEYTGKRLAQDFD